MAAWSIFLTLKKVTDLEIHNKPDIERLQNNSG